MQSDVAELPLPEDPGAVPLPLALGAAAVAASAAVGLWIAGRLRRGEPVVDWRPHDDVPWSGVDVLQVILIHVVVVMVGAAGLGRDTPLVNRLAVTILATVVGMIFSMAYLISRGATLGDLGLGGLRPVADLRLAAATVGLTLAPLLGMAWLLSRLVPYEHDLVNLLAGQRDPGTLALAVVSAVVVAPLTEEFTFRRVLQGWLEKRFPERDGGWAIGLTSAAFAAAHAGQGLAYLPLFLLSLALGYLARRTGTIGACGLAHALFNAVSLALLLTAPAAG